MMMIKKARDNFKKIDNKDLEAQGDSMEEVSKKSVKSEQDSMNEFVRANSVFCLGFVLPTRLSY